MKIRTATQEDIEHSLILLRKCYDEMDFVAAGHSFDPESVRDSLFNIIAGENGSMSIVERNGEIVGAGVVIFAPSPMDRGNRLAMEIIWHSDPELPKSTRVRIMYLLLSEMENQTRIMGVRHLHVTSSVKYPFIGRVLERRGYDLKELHYIREI